MKTITISIDATGEVTLENFGFKGKTCLEASEFIKQVLGEEIARELTSLSYINKEGKEVSRHVPVCRNGGYSTP